MELTKQERFMQVYEPVHERFERFCKTRAYGEFPFKDIMQDTLIVAFEKFDELKSKEAFLHFLFGTSARILANHRKKKRPEYVDQLIAKYEHSECIILFEISGFSIKEIMGIQHLSEAAVKQRLSRGRKQLLSLMKSLELKTV